MSSTSSVPFGALYPPAPPIVTRRGISEAEGLRSTSRMVYRRIVAYARPHALQIAVGMLFTAISTAATIAYFKVAGSLTDAVQDRSVRGLILTLVGFLVLNLIKNAAGYAGSYTITSVGQHVVARVRRDLFERIQFLPLQVFDRWRAGELLSRFANDVNLMVVGVTAMPLFVSAALLLVSSVIWS
jgi:subfamily B ATP-binding cassette protein MsbA